MENEPFMWFSHKKTSIQSGDFPASHVWWNQRVDITNALFKSAPFRTRNVSARGCPAPRRREFSRSTRTGNFTVRPWHFAGLEDEFQHVSTTKWWFPGSNCYFTRGDQNLSTIDMENHDILERFGGFLKWGNLQIIYFKRIFMDFPLWTAMTMETPIWRCSTCLGTFQDQKLSSSEHSWLVVSTLKNISY